MPAMYIGPIEHLRGESALIRCTGEEPEGFVLAQFDACNITRTAKHPPPENFGGPWPEGSLGFGWHLFRRGDFEVTA